MGTTVACGPPRPASIGGLPPDRGSERHLALDGRGGCARLGEFALGRKLHSGVAYTAWHTRRVAYVRTDTRVVRKRCLDGNLLFCRWHGDPARSPQWRAVRVAPGGLA